MADLTIHSRKSWGAKPRRGNVIRRSPGSIRELFVHWPGASGKLIPAKGWSMEAERAIMRQLQQGHFANGWSDIGYSHVMFPNPDGLPRIYTARGAQYVPAAQLRHNTGTIAIMVYMGTDDILHESTKSRLRSYVRWVDDYAGHRVSVRGHRDAVQTTCPGPLLTDWVRAGQHR